MWKNRKQVDCRWSFCGKQQDQVEHLIAGPGVFICAECVRLCQIIIQEERTRRQKQATLSSAQKH